MTGIRHLFIINPEAYKLRGRVNAVIDSINAFFQEYPHMKYDIHVTRWERDALCVVRQSVLEAKELLRVHVMGGSGTLSETVNGAVGLPNVQIAIYPYGNENIFLQYFGADKIHLFASIRSQVFSNTIPIDAIRCGHRYGIARGIIGLEAAVAGEGLKLYENRVIMWQNIAHFLAAIRTIFGSWRLGRAYQVNLDGENLDGEYISMLFANGPVYAKNMHPAVDAHPNDGILDVYLIKKIPKLRTLSAMRKYLSGNHKKLPGIVSHYRGTKITISSDDVMTMLIDDNPFFENTAEFEILPYAVDFVCPGGIDVDKLPRIYGQTETNGNLDAGGTFNNQEPNSQEGVE